MEYSIKEALEITGISIDTLRYYDKEGLFPNLKRKVSGYRVFHDLEIGDIIQRDTVSPARMLGSEKDLGSLSDGSCGDVTIMKALDRAVIFEDWEGDRLLRTMLTIREGQVVFRDIEF